MVNKKKYLCKINKKERTKIYSQKYLKIKKMYIEK